EGVPVASSQINEPSAATKLGRNIPGMGPEDFVDGQLESWRRRVMTRLGFWPTQDQGFADVPSLANPTTLAQARDRISQGFDNTIGSVQSIPGTVTGANGQPIRIVDELNGLRGQIPASLTGAEQAQITRTINTVQNSFQRGNNSIDANG